MAEYIVLAAKHREIIKTKENGQTLTSFKFYKKGDTIQMSPDQADRLVRSGGLRPANEEAAESLVGQPLPGATLDTETAPAGLSGQTVPEGPGGQREPSPDAVEAHQEALKAAEAAREQFNADHGGAPGDPETPDEDETSTEDDGYEDLEYSDLQNLAKARGLEHTGKKGAIIERLRQHDQG